MCVYVCTRVCVRMRLHEWRAGAMRVLTRTCIRVYSTLVRVSAPSTSSVTAIWAYALFCRQGWVWHHICKYKFQNNRMWLNMWWGPNAWMCSGVSWSAALWYILRRRFSHYAHLRCSCLHHFIAIFFVLVCLKVPSSYVIRQKMWLDSEFVKAFGSIAGRSLGSLEQLFGRVI